MAKKIYSHIYSELLKRIKNKTYKTKLPSENDMKKEFEVSRNTIRAAVQLLVDDGICVSSPGLGIFIVQFDQGKHFVISKVESLFETMKRNNQSYETKILTFEDIKIDSALEKITRFSIDTEVLYIRRQRIVDGEGIILDENYLSKEFFPDLSIKKAKKSIYEYLENEKSVKIALTHRSITMDYPNDFQKEAILLKEYPMLATMHNYSYSPDGKQIEYTKSAHRPDWFIFSTVVKRK